MTTKQLYLGGPDTYPVGDCYRTAWANLLGLRRPMDVPHFVQMSIDVFGKGHRIAGGHLDFRFLRQWLRTHGDLDAAIMHMSDLRGFAERESLESYLTVVSVPSRWHEGLSHAVVWDVVADRCVADPSPRAELKPPYEAHEIVDDVGEILTQPYFPGPTEQMLRWESDDPGPVVWPYLYPPLVGPEYIAGETAA